VWRSDRIRVIACIPRRKRVKWEVNELKSEEYEGYTIQFVKRYGRVWAKAPKLSNQYIGEGRTKSAAFKSAKESINRILKK